MEVLRSVASTTLLTLFALVTAIILEHVGPRERYTLRDRLPGFLMNAVGTSLSLAVVRPLNWLWLQLGVPPVIFVPLWHWLEPLGSVGFVAEIVVLIAITDLLAYWRHRAEHAWLWRIHAVHHSPRELHAANDIAHPLEVLFNFAFTAIPLSLIQIDGAAAPIAVGGLVLLASMVIHSPVDWHFGPLRKLLVDNRFHRIHHSLEPRHFHKNFGIFFSIWDRLFGTAYEPGEEWPAVGLADVRAPRTVLQFLEQPFQVTATGERSPGIKEDLRQEG